MSTIIGLSGYMRSGKDTAGAALVNAGWQLGSFAAKLKEFLYAVNPVIPMSDGTGFYRLAELVDAYGWEKAKDDHPEVRALLQRTGTDAGRRVLWEDVWVDAALKDLYPGTPAVFCDVRFPNEARAIQARGGIIVRINRPGHVPGPDAHESETAMDGYCFDAELENTGTVESLHTAIGFIASLHLRATQAA